MLYLLKKNQNGTKGDIVMQYAKSLFVFVISIFLIGCSSMSFIPPQYSLATTDYVDKSLSANVEKTTKKVMSRAEKIINDALEIERARLDSLNRQLDTQQKCVDEVLSSMEEINQKSKQITNIFAKMMKELTYTRREMVDSLDVMSEAISKSVARAELNIRALEESIQKNIKVLEKSDEKFKQLTNRMQNHIELLPKETLQDLQEAINNYYKEKETHKEGEIYKVE